MERVSRWRLALLIALLLTAVQLAAAPSVAQWSVVSPRAILRDNVENTAITYCDGVVWAGCKNLLRSADSGRTWQSVPLDFRESGDRINDIQFFDRNTGIVTTYFGAFLTTDGGRHWMDTLDNQINAVASVTLLSSPRRIAVADFGGEVYLSNDGGAYWSIQRVDSNASQIVYHKGDLYLLASSFVNWGDFFGVLYRSTDRGATWRSLPGQFSSDSYTVMFDSCQGTMYMTNEGFEPQDQSNIITSTDGGTSWQISISSDPEFFSGSLAEGKHVIYTATSTGGVFRYDQSAWKSIGGPNCGVDMRSLCAINDSLLIVVDANGSIWRTENSGGVEIQDVYRAPALSVAKLFASDTLAGCETRSASAVVLPSSGFICTPPTIASQHITGPDSEYYALEHVASANLTALDSEVVLFMPDADRDYSATLVVQLSDGTTMNLDLGGHGTDKAMIRLLAQSITTDTIGDMILPIKTDRDIPSA